MVSGPCRWCRCPIYGVCGLGGPMRVTLVIGVGCDGMGTSSVWVLEGVFYAVAHFAVFYWFLTFF